MCSVDMSPQTDTKIVHATVFHTQLVFRDTRIASAKTRRGIQRPYIAPIGILITNSGDNGIGDGWCVQHVSATVAEIRCTLLVCTTHIQQS